MSRNLLVRFVALGLVLVSGTGCAAVYNMEPALLVVPERPQMKVYGGTRLEIDAPAALLFGADQNAKLVGMFGGGRQGALFGSIDLPFTFIVDTLTLPITIPVALYRMHWPSERSSRSTPSGAGKPPVQPGEANSQSCP